MKPFRDPVKAMQGVSAPYDDMPKYTTIQISIETKALLDELKVHPRQSYNEVIKELIANCADKYPH